MIKTSVYLTPKEYAALQRAARLTRRTQSDLIREGVRRVSMQLPLAVRGQVIKNPGTEWFTREEENAFILKQAGHPMPIIARELRVSEEEARLILARREARSERMFGDPVGD
jgi:hypothetical protein